MPCGALLNLNAYCLQAIHLQISYLCNMDFCRRICWEGTNNYVDALWSVAGTVPAHSDSIYMVVIFNVE